MTTTDQTIKKNYAYWRSDYKEELCLLKIRLKRRTMPTEDQTKKKNYDYYRSDYKEKLWIMQIKL